MASISYLDFCCKPTKVHNAEISYLMISGYQTGLTTIIIADFLLGPISAKHQFLCQAVIRNCDYYIYEPIHSSNHVIA